MAHVVIKQPNGKYAMFSTVSGGFLYTDATKDEMIEEELKTEREEITSWITSACHKADIGGGSGYYTWEIAKEEHEMRHGKLEEETN